MLRKIARLALIAFAAAVPAAPASTGSAGSAGSAGAALREFEGTVVSVNRDNRTFRLRDCERGTVRIKVKRRTLFERIDGFRGLHAGMENVESVVRRNKNGRWVAREVEISGGGGEHGGCDDD